MSTFSHRNRSGDKDVLIAIERFNTTSARTLEGAEVALAHWFWHEFDAQLPDGARTHVRVKVADVVASVALKGLAIGVRYAEKDAYDIFALCAHYQGSRCSCPKGKPTRANASEPMVHDRIGGAGAA